VWIDESEIEHLDEIAPGVDEALEGSKVVLSWLTPAYERRTACRWELSAALLASRRRGEPPIQRIVPVAVDPSIIAAMPPVLRAFRFLDRPQTTKDLDELVAVVAGAVRDADGPIGRAERESPPWLGESIELGAVTGRLAVACLLDGALWPVAASAAGLEGGRSLVVIEALGGAGKTVTAAYYAKTFGSAYDGGIVWLTAHGHDPAWVAAEPFQRDADRRDQLALVAARLSLDLGEVDDQFWPATLGATMTAGGHDVLWVVDDLPSEFGDTELDRWAPRTRGIHVLVTTRDAGGREQSQRLTLPTLEPSAGLEVLTRRLPPSSDDEMAAAAQLVEDVGRHPLALDVIGAAVAAPGGPSYAEIGEELGTSDVAPLVADLAGQLPPGCAEPIVAALAYSIRDLADEGLDFLRLGCQLSTAPIPKAFVASVLGIVSDVDEAMAAKQMRRAFREVEVLKVAERLEDGAAYQLHPIVSMAAGVLEEDPDRAARVRDAAVASLAAELPKAVDIHQHARLRHLVTHGRTLARDARSLDRAAILGWVARYDREQGNYAQSLDGFQRQVVALDRLLGDADESSLDARSNVAESLAGLGHLHEAYEIQLDEYERCRDRFGPEHHSTLASLNNLGSILYQLGRYREAETIQRDVFEQCAKVIGADDESTLKAMGNLAASLAALGRFEEAAQLEADVLARLERRPVPPDRTYVNALHALAFTHRALGDAEESLRLHRREQLVAEEILGPDHPDVVDARFGVALALRAAGRNEEAATELHAVFENVCEHRGADHPLTLSVRSAIAQAALEDGEVLAGVELAKDALVRREQKSGPDHPDTIAALGDLGDALLAADDVNGAIAAFRRQFEARRRILGEGHPSTWTAAANLAMAMTYVDDPGAIELLRRSSERLAGLLGPEHTDTLAAQGNLASEIADLGEVAEATRMQRDILLSTESRLGRHHPDTITAMAQLASTLLDAGGEDASEALELMRAVHERRRDAVGADHPDTALALSNLGAALFNVDEDAEALRCFEDALGPLEHSLGELHRDVLQCRANLAAALTELGRFDEAIAVSAEAVALFDQRHRYGAPYASALINLAVAQAAAGHDDDACARADEALRWARQMPAGSFARREIFLHAGAIHLDAGHQATADALAAEIAAELDHRER
jgi:tetratricopeptide (TPR) repeat protein